MNLFRDFSRKHFRCYLFLRKLNKKFLILRKEVLTELSKQHSTCTEQLKFPDFFKLKYVMNSQFFLEFGQNVSDFSQKILAALSHPHSSSLGFLRLRTSPKVFFFVVYTLNFWTWSRKLSAALSKLLSTCTDEYFREFSSQKTTKVVF